jgi:uncharacterized membrane protein
LLRKGHIVDNNTVLGIDQNLEALLCYVLGWITGIVFLFLEKENEYVRFHAMQSLVTFLALFIITIVIGWIPILGWLISFLISILGLVLWLILMVKAYQGEIYKLPYAGDFAEEQLSRMKNSNQTDNDNL